MIPSYTRLPAALLALLLLQSSPAAAFDLGDPRINCGQAMLDIYGNFEWPGDYYGRYYAQLCQEPNAVVSIYASVYTYCSAVEIDYGIKSLGEYCEKYGKIPLAPASQFAANLTKEAIAQIRVLNQDDVVEESNVTAPFVVAPAWFKLSYRTEVAWQYEERTHVHYL